MEKFWDDLNIKSYSFTCYHSGIGLVTWLRSENLVSALLTIMSSIIGYYFGYENGQKIK